MVFYVRGLYKKISKKLFSVISEVEHQVGFIIWDTADSLNIGEKSHWIAKVNVIKYTEINAFNLNVSSSVF